MSARRIDLAWCGNAAVCVALAGLALILLHWQDEPLQWHLPGADRIVWAGALVALYLIWVLASAWRSAIPRTVEFTHPSGAGAAPSIWVVHASQTGFAEQLAEQTAEALRAGGLSVIQVPLAKLDRQTLTHAKRMLFVASTTGEGDAPDPAATFVRKVMSAAPALAHLEYALLALGDRDYENYCAFGHQLDQWLQRHGAKPLFDLVEVDNGDAGALRHWQHHLRGLCDGVELPDWESPTYRAWTLQTRRLLNPGSAGKPCFHLELTPPARETPRWQAGDIAEIGPRHSDFTVRKFLRDCALDGGVLVQVADASMPLADWLSVCVLPTAQTGFDPQALAQSLKRLPHREYSIASLPSDGALHLLVRRLPLPDGRAGLGSGWLTEHARIGAAIDVRLRRNAAFHPPEDDRPLILIGNGTGLAGLRALLKARIATGHRRNWLLFGERNAAFDSFHGDELQHWHAQGWITALERVYSRDQVERVYVQDRLRERTALLRQWLAEGAAIYVCGSLHGMAPGVHAALETALGADALADLAESGRYRRDVY